MRSIVKKQTGITLIALVVTIIVLIILAGVSIAMLVGENGIITQAQRAAQETEIKGDEEKIKLAIVEAQIGENGYQDLNLDNLQKAIDNQFNEKDVIVSNSEDGTFIISLNNELYKIQNNQLDKIQVDFYISNEKELKEFRDNVNNGNTFEGKTVSLLNNIELTEDWIPIGQIGEEVGSDYEGLGTNYFKGNFLGNGHYIDNINIELSNLQEGYNNVGFFSKTFGNIENLELRNMNINVSTDSGSSFLGAVAGFNYGNILNCKVSGRMVFTSEKDVRIGGIVGQESNGQILNTSSNIQITINKGGIVNLGGIVGYTDNDGRCQNSYNEGDIDIREAANVRLGGIVGYNLSTGSLKNCYNTGAITVEAQYGYVGGIVGGVGNTSIEFKNIYNLGNIDAKINNTQYAYIGGIAGMTYKLELKNAYNIGEIKANVVTANGSYCGGIVAYNISSKINNTYNKGDVVLNNVQCAGSIVGRNVNSDSEIINSYYSNNNGIEAYGENSGYIDDETVKYTTNMPNELDVINEANAFKEDKDNINNGYPILNWQ